MIKIIKHGAKRRIGCGNCGCVMEYEEEDVKTLQTGMNEWERQIECPDCGMTVQTQD